MRKLSLAALVCFLIPLCGCNSRPDPRENPDFDEAAYSDPGSVKMSLDGEDAPKGAP